MPGVVPVFTKQMLNVVQNVAWLPGTTLQPISIPTDLPISRIDITLTGSPTGSVGGGSAGALQNIFTTPAIAQALGLISLSGKSRDNQPGVQIKQVPAWSLWWDAWLLLQSKPDFTDISATTPAAALAVTVPIMFMDPRLPVPQQWSTALEATRFGGQNNLNLMIQTGQLQQATATPDQCVIAGGVYSGAPLGAGTLVVTVTIEQLVPMGNMVWPSWNDPNNALPFLDVEWEYSAQLGLPVANANGVQLNSRGVQAYTHWFNSGAVVTTLAESGVNNLGIAQSQFIIEKIGTLQKNRIDGPTLRSRDTQNFLQTGSFPTGAYSIDDWKDDLGKAYSLALWQGNHQYDTNMGAIPGGFATQNLRLLHKTYNPSLRAKQLNPTL